MLKASEIVKKYNLTGRKELGQNFLLQDKLLDKIVACAGDLVGSDVLEIGPGPGGLTMALLRREPRRLVTIELDRRAVSALEAEIKQFFGNLEIISGDALKIDEKKLFNGKFKIVANPPYNIGTALLLGWLENSADRVESMTLLLQREVVDRIAAVPGTGEYGRLSVICQYLCDVRRCFDIPAGAFVPPPKVASSVVFLTVKSSVDLNLLPRLIALTNVLFAKKRKTIVNNLRVLVPFPREIVNECGLGQRDRAEDLPLSSILNILHSLESRQH